MSKVIVDIQKLNDLTRKPKTLEHGDPLWTDPHIATQMLEAHLDPSNHGASRGPEFNEKLASWLKTSLGLTPGSKVLDLGCGPGLCAVEFAKLGLTVTGVDFSLNSINYARSKATELELPIEYVHGSYLDMDYIEEFDAAFIIYYDLGALSLDQRQSFLSKVKNALKSGGKFAFDVITEPKRQESIDFDSYPRGGFFSPKPHFVTTNTFHYLQENAWLDQYVIWEEAGPRVIRTWDYYFTPKSITQVLEQAGFRVLEIREDLTGTPYTSESKSLAVLAQVK